MKKDKTEKCSNCGTSEKNPVQPTISVSITYAGEEAEKKKCKKPSNTAQERIEALRSAGVDVSNLFAIHGANGGEFIASNKDGKLSILDEHDPIFSYITNQGTVPNRSLFRRYVMAQMFHMMSYTERGQKEPVGVTNMIHRLGYEYQWKMLMNELKAQMKMEGKDVANYLDRNRWFNAKLVTHMAEDYIAKLKKHVLDQHVKYCKGIPYKHLGGKNIFVIDILPRIYTPLSKSIIRIMQAKNAAELYEAAKKFNEMRIKIASDTPQCKEWIDAYKGAGAYFTMQNLIRFHNCQLRDASFEYLNKFDSEKYLLELAILHSDNQGYCMLGILKKMLIYNNINIYEKMKEWRKK